MFSAELDAANASIKKSTEESAKLQSQIEAASKQVHEKADHVENLKGK